MHAIKFNILPPPDILKNDVACFRTAAYTGEEALAIKVCLNGAPGIVFQHHNGRSPIESITTATRCKSPVSTLYVYGQVTEPSVMNHRMGPYTMTQVILKPHALRSILGINASALTDTSAELSEFSAKDLNARLLEANDQQQRVDLLTDFLVAKFKQTEMRDTLVEESIRFIHRNVGSATVEHLLEHLHISQRQFERRFSQAVGISPQFYIRVKRFNEAIRLIKSGQYPRMTDIAHGLNFYDQSHFIRDIKAFSGITPKGLSQKEGGFLHDQVGYAYL